MYADSTVSNVGYGEQGAQVSTVSGPVHCAVTVYQTSGVLAEAPQGTGVRVPGSDGVAQMFEPQMYGAFNVIVNGFEHGSFGGGVVET